MVRERRRSERACRDLTEHGWTLGILVFVTALLVRAAVIVALPEGLQSDRDGYRLIAITMRATGVFGVPLGGPAQAWGEPPFAVRPTAYRPPLYPALLALLVTDGRLGPLPIGTLHVLLGGATVLAVHALGRTWGLGSWSAVGAGLTACDPILLHQSAQIMTETFAAFLAVMALSSLTYMIRRGTSPETAPAEGQAPFRNPLAQTSGAASKMVGPGAAAGVVIGLACLCRPTFLPWLGLVLASLALCRWPTRQRMVVLTSLLVGTAVVLVPWGLRNAREFGHFNVSTTHGGYTLLLGNNPGFYDFLRAGRRGDVWGAEDLPVVWQNWISQQARREAHTSTPRSAAGGGSDAPQQIEVESDQFAYQLARQFIRAEPDMFAWACGVRIGRFWQLMPHQVEMAEPSVRHMLRWATAAWYAAVLGLAVAGAVTTCVLRRDAADPCVPGAANGGRSFRTNGLLSPWWMGTLLCLAFTSVHAVYWSDMRMRGPVMPFVCLAAAAGGRRIQQIVAGVRGQTDP